MDAGTRRPLARIPVYLWREGPQTGAVVQARADTDGEGTFQVLYTTAATYQLTFGDSARPISRGPVDVLKADSTLLRAYHVPLSSHVFKEAEVEYPVTPLGSRKGPRYPSAHLEKKTPGEVHARWIVDTAGAVVRESVEIIFMSAPEFGASVREHVLPARFVPARWRGHLVHQLVEQPFSFLAMPEAGGARSPRSP